MMDLFNGGVALTEFLVVEANTEGTVASCWEGSYHLYDNRSVILVSTDIIDIIHSKRAKHGVCTSYSPLSLWESGMVFGGCGTRFR